MKRILIYAVFFMIAFSSCVVEEQEERTYEEVYINLSTRTLDPSLTDVRIIVTDNLSGAVLINQYPAQRESSGDYKLTVRTGELNFYIILNETSRLTTDLNNVKTNSAIKKLILNRDEIPATETTDNSTTRTNLPAVGYVKALIRPSAIEKKSGEASIDGGSTWNSMLTINVERLASKITLYLRKQTPANTDAITIKSVTAVNSPQYSYILPQPYLASGFNTEPLFNGSLSGNISFPANDETYTPAVLNLLLPEYIPADITDKNKALTLKIDGTYNNIKTEYIIPVRGNLDVDDYSLKRNNHYIVYTTISSKGDLTYIPEVQYQVAGWNEAGINPEFVGKNTIKFSRDWAPDTNFENNTTIRIDGNGYAEFYFDLTNPEGSKWTATLTNPFDFMFDDLDGAVSSGVARNGQYKIRIKPRRETQLNNIRTEFYITVMYPGGQAELNLPDEVVGSKRYTIIQTPS